MMIRPYSSAEGGLKYEARISKSETYSNDANPNVPNSRPQAAFGFEGLGFRARLGFRYSDIGFGAVTIGIPLR